MNRQHLRHAIAGILASALAIHPSVAQDEQDDSAPDPEAMEKLMEEYRREKEASHAEQHGEARHSVGHGKAEARRGVGHDDEERRRELNDKD